MTDRLPRRVHLERLSVGELAIYNAMAAVEGMGANMHLTRAVMLLIDARSAVADFVDNVPEPDPFPRVPAGTRLSGDDATPGFMCTNGCHFVVTGRHEQFCCQLKPAA